MLTAQGPRTDVNSTTTYTYYTCTTGAQCGQLETVTDPVGNVTTYNTYNAHGQPLTITDPNGVVTTLTCDNRLRLTCSQLQVGGAVSAGVTRGAEHRDIRLRIDGVLRRLPNSATKTENAGRMYAVDSRTRKHRGSLLAISPVSFHRRGQQKPGQRRREVTECKPRA